MFLCWKKKTEHPLPPPPQSHKPRGNTGLLNRSYMSSVWYWTDVPLSWSLTSDWNLILQQLIPIWKHFDLWTSLPCRFAPTPNSSATSSSCSVSIKIWIIIITAILLSGTLHPLTVAAVSVLYITSGDEQNYIFSKSGVLSEGQAD